MSRRARFRKLAKWTGTVLTLLLFVAWIASTRYSASHTWNVRTDPTPASARPKESVPFDDLTNIQWTFLTNGFSVYRPSQFRHQVGFVAGRIYFYHDDDDGCGWWTPDDPRWSMRPGFDARIAPDRRGFRPAFFALPLWFPVALIGIPTGLLWRTDLRARRVARLNLCTRCGYDLAATAVAAPCPECGKVRPAERVRSAERRALVPNRMRRNLARVGAVLTILLFIGWIGSAYVYREYRWNIRPILPRPADASTATQDRASPSMESGHALRFEVRLPRERWDEVGIRGGRVWVALDMPITTWGGMGAYAPGRLDLWPVLVRNESIRDACKFVSIPIWIPFLLVAIPTALLWRSGRHWPHAARRG